MVTPIQKAINNLLTRATGDRPPLAIPQSGGLLSGASALTTPSAEQNLNAMTSTGWLFAIVERISTAMAATEWHLYRKEKSGRVRIEDHPVLDLWNNPNPFFSRSEFIETSSTHFELTGEMVWVIVRGMAGSIVELWCIRPDRIRPIPSKDDYISGYIYQVGRDEIPLETQDVVFTKRPHPTDQYRGVSQVASILHDIGSEQLASAWQRNFFNNSALPGGLIEMDHNLSPQDFSRLAERWKEQHQGVSNSHRVAILERGKWVERRYSQRDMQFKESRQINRDIILGAYGFPTALLGVSENVNKANAEAAELMFARWLIRPRLIRMREKLNQGLVAQFDEKLMLDFVDPVPEDRALDMTKSERGYSTGILTLNEARRLIGEGEVDEGDQYRVAAEHQSLSDTGYGSGLLTQNEAREIVNLPPVPDGDEFKPPERAATPFAASVTDSIPKAITGTEEVKASDPLKPTEIELAEEEMNRGWKRRLRSEMSALISTITLHGNSNSIEANIVDGHDWDWGKKFGDELQQELIETYEASLRAGGYRQGPQEQEAGFDNQQTKRDAPDDLTEPIIHSINYAKYRAIDILSVAGSESLLRSTKERVSVLVARSMERGEGIQSLARSIRKSVVFSASRAETIARTETAKAYGEGTAKAAVLQGQDQKRWITQGDDLVDSALCMDNEDQGWISIGELFASGDSTIPAHPNCRCTVRYRDSDLFEAEPDKSITPQATTLIPEARCGQCNKLLQKNYTGGMLYCSRCKNETEFA